MELKVGMYVRLDRDQGIRKLVNYNYGVFDLDEPIYTEFGAICFTIRENSKDILEASFNIIDLIEKGDYVNGKTIVDIGCLINGTKKGTKAIDYYITPNALCYFENDDIRSVVTKEEFEKIEYLIRGEENGNN